LLFLTPRPSVLPAAQAPGPTLTAQGGGSQPHTGWRCSETASIRSIASIWKPRTSIQWRAKNSGDLSVPRICGGRRLHRGTAPTYRSCSGARPTTSIESSKANDLAIYRFSKQRRRDGGKRSGQGIGIYGAPAGRTGHALTDFRRWSMSASPS